MVTTIDLLAYWKMDDASGNMIDAKNSNDGTVTGVTQGATGKINDAYDFEGNPDKVVVADNATFNDIATNNEITLSFWLKAQSYAGAESTIISRWSDAGGLSHLQFLLLHNNSAGAFRFLVHGTSFDIGIYDHSISKANFADNTWHHWMVTWDAANECRMWKDGTEVTVTHSLGAESIQDVDKTIVLGDVHDGGAWYDGLMDEFGIWARALSDSDNDDLYNAGAGLAYPFEEVTATLRQIKISGTFVDKPILTKVAGSFVDKPIKIKVGGTFQDA